MKDLGKGIQAVTATAAAIVAAGGTVEPGPTKLTVVKTGSNLASFNFTSPSNVGGTAQTIVLAAGLHAVTFDLYFAKGLTGLTVSSVSAGELALIFYRD